jgi:gliding motility-associated-like protein
MKNFFILFILIFSLKGSYSHSVQVVWCQSCQGLLRLYVEHWHGGASAESTTMTISVTVDGTTTTATGSPIANLQGLDKDDLPGCATPPTTFASCGRANGERDWVYYDFPQVPCGVPVDITVISGNNQFTQDCDGNMFPASTGQFTMECGLQQNVILLDQVLCQEENFDAAIINDSLTSPNFTWTNDNPNIGLPASGNGYLPSFITTGTNQQEVGNLTFQFACFLATSRITVNPKPSPSFFVGNFVPPNGNNITGNLCLYDSIKFQNTSDPNNGTITSLNWDFGDGQTLNGVQNPTIKYTTEGVYNIKIVTENSNGCIDSITRQVEVYPIPTAILKISPACLNTPIIFRDSSYINAPGYVDYVNIDFGDGSPNSTTINDSHIYPSDVTYPIVYSVYSNRGCVDSVMTNTAEIFSIPIANFQNTVICENTPPTNFINNSTINKGSIINWTWNFDDDNNNTSNLVNPDHLYEEPGTYNVKLIVESDEACKDTLEQSVIVLAKPTTIFISNITEDCQEACINFLDYSLPNAFNTTSWKWTFGDGQTSILQNPSHCYTNYGNINDSRFTVSLYTTNDLGCSDSVTVQNYINVWPNPVSNFDINPSRTDMYHTEVAFTNKSIGANYYSWNLKNRFLENDFEPTYTYVQDSARHYIYLIAETNHGCVDTSRKLLIIDPVVTIYVPNSFTPNGDGRNDVFFVEEFGIIKELLKFQIFDRWGKLIYYTENYQPWDGTYLGSPAQQDTYVYRIEYVDALNKKGERIGHVNLLK